MREKRNTVLKRLQKCRLDEGRGSHESCDSNIKEYSSALGEVKRNPRDLEFPHPFCGGYAGKVSKKLHNHCLLPFFSFPIRKDQEN